MKDKATRAPHIAATCPFCVSAAKGVTSFRNGEPFPELCPECGYHHLDSYPCPGKSLPRSTCPRCKTNKRALEHIIEAFNADRKRYAPYCADCMAAEGYVLERAGELEYWTKPAAASEARDPFEGMGGPSLRPILRRSDRVAGATRRAG